MATAWPVLELTLSLLMNISYCVTKGLKVNREDVSCFVIKIFWYVLYECIRKQNFKSFA